MAPGEETGGFWSKAKAYIATVAPGSSTTQIITRRHDEKEGRNLTRLPSSRHSRVKYLSCPGSVKGAQHSRENIEDEIKRLEKDAGAGAVAKVGVGVGDGGERIGGERRLKIEYLGKEWRFGRMIAVAEEGEGGLVFREERGGDVLRGKGVGMEIGVRLGIVPRSASARLKERCRRDFNLHQLSRGDEGGGFRDSGDESKDEEKDGEKDGEKETEEIRTQDIRETQPNSLARPRPAPLSFSSYQWDGRPPSSPPRSPTLQPKDRNYDDAPARAYWKNLPSLSSSLMSCKTEEVNTTDKNEERKDKEREVKKAARTQQWGSYRWESRRSLVDDEGEDEGSDSELDLDPNA